MNRGRPEFEPTDAHRLTVEQLIATGHSKIEIAAALRINGRTLRKHFRQELSFGLAHRRAEIIENLFAAGRKGNVAALKRLEEMTRLAGAEAAFEATLNEPAGKKDQAMARARVVGANGRYAVPAAPKLGKKEQAQRDAETAGIGTSWEDLLHPTLKEPTDAKATEWGDDLRPPGTWKPN